MQFQPGRLLGSVHCEPLCSDDKFVPPKRFPVHDELASFPDSRGDQVEVRIRVWMGKNATPIALVSQVGDVHPRQITLRVANYIQESILKFNGIGYLYFEWGKAPATMTGICSKPEWLMSGNWCDCRALAQRDGAPPRRKSLPDGRMRGE